MVTRTRHQPECRLTSESPSRSGDFSSPARTNRGSEGTRERGSEGAHARARTYARTRAHTHLQTHTNACERKHMGGGEPRAASLASRPDVTEQCVVRVAACACRVRVTLSSQGGLSESLSRHIVRIANSSHYVSIPGLVRVTISSESQSRPCHYFVRASISSESPTRPSHSFVRVIIPSCSLFHPLSLP